MVLQQIKSTKVTKQTGPTKFINELKSIKSFDLISKSATVFEKIVWGAVFIVGIIWATFFMVNEFQTWQVNPSIIRHKKLQLSDIPYPAITFCSQSSTKFAIAERLGNYLNSDYGLPDHLLESREVLLKYFLAPTSLTSLPNVKDIEDVTPCPYFGCKVGLSKKNLIF